MKHFALPLLLAVMALCNVSCESLSSRETPLFKNLSFKNLGAARGEKARFAKRDSTKGLRATGQVMKGKASWYGVQCNGGTHTASGETLHDYADTAAHKTLPLGTHVKVTNLANGREAVVRINDRGPYIAGRIIDVTRGVAEDLDFIGRGVTPVAVQIMEPMPIRLRTSRRPADRNE